MRRIYRLLEEDLSNEPEFIAGIERVVTTVHEFPLDQGVVLTSMHEICKEDVIEEADFEKHVLEDGSENSLYEADFYFCPSESHNLKKQLVTTENEGHILSKLEGMKSAYLHMISERDMATKLAEEALSMFREIKEKVSELTIELNSMKLSLENDQEALLEAEGQLYVVKQSKERQTEEWAKEIGQVIEELDGVQKVFDLVQCSMKSENSGLAMEEVV